MSYYYYMIKVVFNIFHQIILNNAFTLKVNVRLEVTKIPFPSRCDVKNSRYLNNTFSNWLLLLTSPFKHTGQLARLGTMSPISNSWASFFLNGFGWAPAAYMTDRLEVKRIMKRRWKEMSFEG